MKIDVRFRGQVGEHEALREHVLRSAHFQLGRFGHALSAVVVRLSDVNGPKGGVDKRCQVSAGGPQVGSLIVEELQGELKAAIDLTMERLARALGQRLERLREARRAGPASLEAT